MSSTPLSEVTPASRFVVENFEGAEISWTKAYAEAAQRYGFDQLQTTGRDTLGHRIFLGDTLPRELGGGGLALYFLAAADQTPEEHASALRCDTTTTVSTAEKERLLTAFPSIDERRVHVDGFPVYDEERYDTIKRAVHPGEQKKVAFIGRAALDKGPALELRLADALVRSGVDVHHLSNTTIPIASELRSLGVNVRERLEGDDYLKTLASAGSVINTSPRESLFVSGIEATALGVPVFAVDHPETGIRDWNAPDRFYDSRDEAGLLERVHAILDQDPIERRMPDVSRYQQSQYFSRINDRLEEARV